MKNNQIITTAQVIHVAKLANLTISESSISDFRTKLSSILDYVNVIQAVSTKNINPTTQVTGLTNILREDVIDSSRTFTQDQALLNASDQHNGYFVVPAIFENAQ